MNFRKYLVLAGVTVFAVAGDSMLSHGMKQVGAISLHHLQSVFLAVANPWVALGILFLLGFFAAYMNALSWADLTYDIAASPRTFWAQCRRPHPSTALRTSFSQKMREMGHPRSK